MVKVVYGRNFEKQVRKIKDEKLKEKVKKQIRNLTLPFGLFHTNKTAMA